MILDCDPGHDDALAILLAAQHAELLGVTTVSGNAPLSATTRNALLTLQLGAIDVPVHAGAARPLVGEPSYAPDIHGESGLSGPALPELTREPVSDNAVGFIVDTARAIADGLGNREIAERLGITVATVKAHTSSLFSKLEVDNRVRIALLVRDAEHPGPGPGH